LKRIGFFAVLAASSVCLYFLGRYNYLLFHFFVEGYSIVIAAGIFIVSWNTRKLGKNDHLVFLGVAYLFIGILDSFHTISYTGMNVIPGHFFYANQLWVGTRFIEAVSLLVFAILGKERFRIRFRFIVPLYIVVTSLFLYSVFIARNFPVCFVPGMGQTAFKIIGEYVICGILLGSLALFYRNRKSYDTRLFYQITASILVTVVSELFFTVYTDNFGITNVLGHLCKILSFYLIYHSVIVNTLKRPFDILYEELVESKEHLSLITDNLPVFIGHFDRDLNYLFANKYLTDAEEVTQDAVIGRPVKESAGRSIFADQDEAVQRVLSGSVVRFERSMDTKRMPSRIVQTTFVPQISGDTVTGFFALAYDITELREAENRILHLLDEKNLILHEVHHRIKNNMATIMSLLRLQAVKHPSPEVSQALQESMSRVQSMTVLYDKLYRAENVNALPLSLYLSSLITEIIELFSSSLSITLNVDLPETVLSPDILSPLGIAVNEMITNSMKYAFSGREKGAITVKGSTQGDTVILRYSDDGIGVGNAENLRKSKGFGMSLIFMLVKQIQGRLDVTSKAGEGVTYTIEFPIRVG